MADIVDFKTRAAKIAKRKEQPVEADPLKEFFSDKDITDLFISALMFLRHASTSQDIELKLDEDRLEIISKNLTEFDVNDIDIEHNHVKIASMDLTDDDGEELPIEVLTKLFQQCVEAVTIRSDLENEPDNPEEHS